jgi:hypothetical protein
MEPEKESDAPSAYESRFFSAPEPPNEQSRQLTLNRLGIFGGQPYDTTEEGLVKWKGRVEAGEKMLAEGTAPLSLESAWERPASSLSNSDNLATASERRSVPPPPETLEQHPVLRKIVNECRKLFNTSLCLLSVSPPPLLVASSVGSDLYFFYYPGSRRHSPDFFGRIRIGRSRSCRLARYYQRHQFL